MSKFTDFLQANGIWAATRPFPEFPNTQVRTTYVPARTDGKKKHNVKKLTKPCSVFQLHYKAK